MLVGCAETGREFVSFVVGGVAGVLKVSVGALLAEVSFFTEFIGADTVTAVLLSLEPPLLAITLTS